MTIDTKKLRELAGKATPGPWKAKGFGIGAPGRDFGIGFCHGFQDDADEDDEDGGIHNAAFIAAANPQTVIALLDEVERLRELADNQGCVHAPACDGPDGDHDSACHANANALRDQLAAMTRARDSLAAIAESLVSGVSKLGGFVYPQTEESIASLRHVGTPSDGGGKEGGE